MDTTDRQQLHNLAHEMEATFAGDEKGLKDAQQNAHHVIEGLKSVFPDETDETLCQIARAVCQTVSRLGNMPLALASASIEAMCASYPLAAAALINVYTLPEHECVTTDLGLTPAPESKPADDGLSGPYL